MGTLVMIGQLILSFSILIILHEFGHFSTAKWFKTRVEKFYLFFNPGFSLVKAKKVAGKWSIKSMFSKEKDFPEGDPDATTYGIGWLPLGGYVKISGMIDESMDKEQMDQPPKPWEFRSKPAWQRLIIMLAGVFINFVLGFLIMGFMLWQYGKEYLPMAEVNKHGIYADSLGQELGLQTGDKILKFGDKDFDRFNDRLAILELVINGSNTITIERDGQQQVLTVQDEVIKSLASHKNNSLSIFSPLMPFAIGEISKGSPAEKAGFQVRDVIVGINGQATPHVSDIFNTVSKIPNTETEIQVLRNASGDNFETGDTLSLTATVGDDGTLGILAISPDQFFQTKRETYTLSQAVPLGFQEGWDFIAVQLKAFGQMFKGRIKASESLGGFGTFAKMYGTTWDWERFWRMTAIVSLILGFMNLLPIPALDGGYAAFLIFEVLTGIKPSDKFVEKAVTVGFILMMGLFVYANGLDVFRAFN